MNTTNTKILLITYYWPPSGGPGVQRWLKFSKYLPEFGITPIILTVDPEKANYPIIDNSLLKEVSEDLKVVKTDNFDIFTTFRKLLGMKEYPVSGFSNQENKSWKDILIRIARSHAFIPDPRRGWNKYAIKSASELIEKEGIQHIITTSPPHSTQLIGLALKKKYPHIKWIADFRDPWTDIYYYKELYHSFLSATIDRYYEKKVVNNADAIITVSPDFKRIFDSICKKDKAIVLPNGYDLNDFANQNNLLKTDKDIIEITYTGTITEQYPIKSLLNVIQNYPQIRLKFVGKIAKQVRDWLTTYNLIDRTTFIDYVPHKESIQYLLASDLLLLAIPNEKNNQGILPGKLFEYLAANKPIINMGPKNGDAAIIINNCKSGVTFEENNEQQMIDFFNNLPQYLAKFSNNTDLIYSYNRKTLTERLVSIIKNNAIKPSDN